jgi:hypothetical protein
MAGAVHSADGLGRGDQSGLKLVNEREPSRR